VAPVVWPGVGDGGVAAFLLAFESGLNAPITINTAMTAMAIAHQRRHHGRGDFAED
jgi:hypothetical protein